ncbi:MAG: hypothetical protein FWE04_03540 [Oscillospiraceae bacterium]|nr:hypothetical protein [Oscillospiraceae bacterium]
MKFARKHLMAISLIAGITLLTGSVFANLGSANGYSETKEAIRSLIFADNFTIEMEMSFSINGQTVNREGVFAQYDMGSDVSQKQINTSVNYLRDWSSSSTTHIQDGVQIWSRENTQTGRVDHDVWQHRGRNDSNWMGISTDEHSMRIANRTINFAEVAADMVMGGLKSNIVMVSDEDGIRTYEMNLSRRQVPGIVQSGISLLFSMNGHMSYANPNDAMGDPIYMLGDDPVIDFVKISTSVDRDGNLRAVSLNTALVGGRNGERNTVEFSFDATLWDFGTTVIERFDVDAIPDEMERMENNMTEHMQAHRDNHVEFLRSLDLSEEELDELIREFERDLAESFRIEYTTPTRLERQGRRNHETSTTTVVAEEVLSEEDARIITNVHEEEVVDYDESVGD